MVSEEDKQSSSDLPDAVKALARKALGLSASYVSNDSDASPMLSSEEPARKTERSFGDAGGVASIAANNNEPSDVVEMKPALSGLVEAMGLIAQIEQLSGDSKSDLADELQQLKQYVQSAIKGKHNTVPPNLGDIAGKISAARSEEVSKNETPQQKMDRLWNEVKELNKKIDDKFDELKANGARFDEADEKKREELKKRADAGDLAAQEELQKLEKQMLEKLAEKQPELVPQISETMKLLKEREEKFREFLKKKKELNDLSKEQEELYRKNFNERTNELKDESAIKEDIQSYGYQLKTLTHGSTEKKITPDKPQVAATVAAQGFSFDAADA